MSAIETVQALTRRCLWIAYAWNDHNFEAAHLFAKREAEAHGIKSFEDANAFLAQMQAAPPECQTEAEKTAYAFGWWKAMETLARENERLRAAIQRTLDENGHLADGDVCTLRVLKDAIAAAPKDQP